jgi:O-antigen/teichoic acid export membrane protein
VLAVSAVFWRRLRTHWPLVPPIGSLWADRPTDGRQYIRPTVWVLADRNLGMLYGAAPIALAALFLTATDISYFKIALGWVTLALAVLSPMSVLLNTELARIQVQEPTRLRSRFVGVTALAMGASTVVTLAAAVLAGPVFSLLYGSEYSAAAPLVYWFIPFGVLFGIGIALGPMWRALNRVRVSILINIAVLVVGAPLALIAMREWGALGAVAMVTGWYTVSHLVSFSYLMKTLGRERGVGSRVEGNE